MATVGDMLERRRSGGTVYLVVFLLVGAGLGTGGLMAADTDSAFRNETSYSLVVEVRDPAPEGEGTVHFEGTLHPGDQHTFSSPAGQNLRPWITAVLYDGAWYGTDTCFFIQQRASSVNTNWWRPRKPTERSWCDTWGCANPDIDYLDFAAGTTFVLKGWVRQSGGYTGIYAETKATDGHWNIIAYSPTVRITIQNNTVSEIEIRPIDTDGNLLVSSPGWQQVQGGLQGYEEFEAPWHMEITNDGGNTVWETPEPGMDKTYLVSGDGQGGLMLTEGEDSGGDSGIDVEGEVPDIGDPDLPDQEDPGTLHDEATEELNLDRWDTGDTGGDYFWDNTAAAVGSYNWEDCAPELNWSATVGGHTFDLNLDWKDEDGNVWGWFKMLRWAVIACEYFFTVLLILWLLVGSA